MSAVPCPFCGRDRALAHGEDLCPVLDSSLTRMAAAAAAIVQDASDKRIEKLALSRAATPRRVQLDNGAGNGQMVLGFDLGRGIALLYNDDLADVWLGEDRQHIEDPTKRFPLKAKGALAITSPHELWAIGSAAGPQSLYALELPPGRQAAELAQLIATSATVSALPGDASAAPGAAESEVAYMMAFNGATWDRVRDALALDAGLAAGVLAAHVTKTLSTGGVFTSLNGLAACTATAVGAANAANVLVLDLRDLSHALDIAMVCSGGTATLQVEVSIDNATWIAIEAPIVAAAATYKHYSTATVGATNALCPLAFRYVRITAGAAGVGNTTTLTVSAK